MKISGVLPRVVRHTITCLCCAVRVIAISSAECWHNTWTPEVCCGSPGAKGNPLCWDEVLSYNQCCAETEEGVQFDLRRQNFLADMVRRGATVHFSIRTVSSGRTGAVASKTLSKESTALRIPSTQVFSLKSIPPLIAAAGQREACDAHAQLALGLAYERVNPMSRFADWIKLLPSTFANVLWFTPLQLELISSTFFAYIAQSWLDDLNCMQRAVEHIPDRTRSAHKADLEDFRWALSIVKTRGFAFEGTHESTMLIPLADFWNHDVVANVRTASFAEDALRFVATRDIMLGEELCIDYGQSSNLEFMVRYGFRIEENPYGGRQFDLGGDPLQAHCPSFLLRYDLAEIIENATIDCHRQARYVSFEQQFGQIQQGEQLREDRYIYDAIEKACQQLLELLPLPSRSLLNDPNSEDDRVTPIILEEIRMERVLLQRCQNEFRDRQLELEPRFLPTTLAAPLAQFHASRASSLPEKLNIGLANTLLGDSDNFDGNALELNSFARDQVSHAAGFGEMTIDDHGVASEASTSNSKLSSFSASIDRSRVDQLLHKLQHGLSLQ